MDINEAQIGCGIPGIFSIATSLFAPVNMHKIIPTGKAVTFNDSTHKTDLAGFDYVC